MYLFCRYSLNLTFAVDGSLMTVVGSGTVFHAVRTCEHEVGILFALHIDGRTAQVGDAGIVHICYPFLVICFAATKV